MCTHAVFIIQTMLKMDHLLIRNSTKNRNTKDTPAQAPQDLPLSWKVCLGWRNESVLTTADVSPTCRQHGCGYRQYAWISF